MAAAALMAPPAYEPPLGRGAFSPVMPSLSQHISKSRLAVSTSTMTNESSGRTELRSNNGKRTVTNLEQSKSHNKSTTRSARASTLPTTPSRSAPSKLHKTNRRPAAPSSGSFGDSRPSFTPPQAVPEEPSSTPHVSAFAAPSSSTPKLRPYLRKISGSDNTKEERDQGRLDLSRSRSETDPLSGLGIRDYGTPRGVLDGPLMPTHSRNISSGSQVSINSASALFRPPQPLVQPLRPTPRPFASGPTASLASSVVGDGGDEEDEFNAIHEAGDYYYDNIPRTHRSHSISTMGAPTNALSPPYTGSDLALPQLQPPLIASASQTNLSTHSRRSSRSILGRARRDTDLSRETHLTSPDSRTSLDQSFSFAAQRDSFSEARIQAARQRFEEKEAHKDRKLAQRQAMIEARNAARQRHDHRDPHSRRESITSIATAPGGTLHVVSTASPPPTHVRALSQHSTKSQRDTMGVLRAHAYENLQPAPLPSSILVTDEDSEISGHEKSIHPGARSRRDSPQKGFARFSAWLHTRAMSCAKALA